MGRGDQRERLRKEEAVRLKSGLYTARGDRIQDMSLIQT